MVGHRTFPSLALLGGLAFALIGPGMAHEDEKHDDGAVASETPAALGGGDGHKPIDVTLAMPVMNSERGMSLFIEKGCVTCHSVNGVGGHDASPLDAHAMDPVMNVFEFAAKMWAMAPYMIQAQEEALGEQVLFTGEELAHIIAFVHDDETQHHLTEAMIPPHIEMLMHHEHGGMSAPTAHGEEIGHGEGHGHDAGQDHGHDKQD